jgi:hypothetical protein
MTGIKIDGTKPNDNYKVLSIDISDNSVELLNLSMVDRLAKRGFNVSINGEQQIEQRTKSIFGLNDDIPPVGCVVWCYVNKSALKTLEQGDIITGEFNFDPILSESKSQLPKFVITQKV